MFVYKMLVICVFQCDLMLKLCTRTFKKALRTAGHVLIFALPNALCCEVKKFDRGDIDCCLLLVHELVRNTSAKSCLRNEKWVFSNIYKLPER